jgi:hypothetical protein
MWSADEAWEFLRTRVIIHKQARVKLPECTREERWARADQFALMKQGGKRAVKLYDTLADAASHASTSPELYVEPRPGESIRCAAYCSVSRFCSQFNQKPQKKVQEIEEIIA